MTRNRYYPDGVMHQPDHISNLGQAAIHAIIEKNDRTGLPELNIVGSLHDSDDVIWREQVWGIDTTPPADPWNQDLVIARVNVLLLRFTRALHVALLEQAFDDFDTAERDKS